MACQENVIICLTVKALAVKNFVTDWYLEQVGGGQNFGELISNRQSLILPKFFTVRINFTVPQTLLNPLNLKHLRLYSIHDKG